MRQISSNKIPIVLGMLFGVLCATAQGTPGQESFPPPRQNYEIQTPTYLSDYFEKGTSAFMVPDSAGFIRRWSVLEPISKPNRSNVVFTDSYLNHVLDSIYFKGQTTIVPRDGQKVKVDGKTLKWHSLDSKLFNFKLYRFAAALKKPVYGIIFFAVNVIDCPDSIPDVRLSVGSNSASKWWLNGEEVLLLSGDRRMVADDAVSKRLTLKKGKNILRCAVINGPGMSDFCARFIDEDGNPINNFRVSYQ
ncbi:MAG: acetylxylan esterase [Muribaculum sp.]|nr:acetylxylan esterase [Muribaculum sp.]